LYFVGLKERSPTYIRTPKYASANQPRLRLRHEAQHVKPRLQGKQDVVFEFVGLRKAHPQPTKKTHKLKSTITPPRQAYYSRKTSG